MRPTFVTQNDLDRWNKKIKEDHYLPKGFGDKLEEREVLYAGLWLLEQLQELECPDNEINKLLYVSGKLSYNQDTWEVHQLAYKLYKESLDEITEDLIPSELDDYDNLYEDDGKSN